MELTQKMKRKRVSFSNFGYLYLGLGTLYLLHYTFYGSPVLLPDTPMYLPDSSWNFSLVSFAGDMPRPWVVTFPFAVLGYPLKIVIFHYLLAFFSGCYLLWTAINISKSCQRGYLYIVVCFGFLISGPPLEWASSIQSDSLAMTLALTFVYGIVGFLFDKSHRKLHSCILLISGTLASQIRIFALIFFVPLFVYSSIQLFKSIGGRSYLRGKIAIFMIFIAMSVAYSTSLQSKMDLAWGKVLAQHEMVHGRTMQQLGVMSMNPAGAEAVNKIIEQGKYTCIKRERNDPEVFWWGELAHRCTSEVEEFSNVLIGDYLVYLISHPRGTLQSFGGTYTETFNFTRGFLPNPLLDIFASRTAYQPTLLLLALLVATIFLAPRRFVTRHRVLAKIHDSELESKTVLAVALCGHIAILLSAFYSPSDTYRIASSLTTSTLFLTLFLVVTFVSLSESNLHNEKSFDGADVQINL